MIKQDVMMLLFEPNFKGMPSLTNVDLPTLTGCC